jgi:alpha-beta hydrolase superfamily lysophospholipase
VTFVLEETVDSTKGIRLFVRSWTPDREVRATLVVCHGFNSHSAQFTWAAEQLAIIGLAVFALDFRGRGRSEGSRFVVEDIADYVSDLASTVALVRSRHPRLAMFLLGHSVGGVVAATYLLENQDRIAGFICESFAFEVPAPDFALTAIKWLSHIAPRLPVVRLRNGDFSRDPATVRALNADSLTAGETQPAIMIAALLRANRELRDRFPSLALPLLILHGTADRATEFHGSQFFYETAGSIDKTLKLYEGHYHDLLNDVGKEEVMADIQRWIRERLPAVPVSVRRDAGVDQERETP